MEGVRDFDLYGRSIQTLHHLQGWTYENGMAESFVNTFKRDYVSRMDLTDARTVMTQMEAAFEHFNEVHPHSSLKMKSPREFRQHRAAQRRLAQAETLHCE